MPQKTRRAKIAEAARKSRMPMNSQQEKRTIILRMAERSGEKSMKVVGKRIERGIRAAFKAGKANG